MSFRREWTRFRALPSTLGPTEGVREAWHQGRRWYAVWVLRVEDPAVRARRDAVARALGGLVLPFSEDTPHVTVWVAGWSAPDATPTAGLTVPLSVGRVNAFASCPYLEVRAPALRGLRAHFGGVEERWAPYRPHLTVARFRREVPTRDVVLLLRPFRRLGGLSTVGVLTPAWVDAFSETGGLVYDAPS